jgi:hypothetical protein
MDETFPHLRIQREEPVNEKRPGTYMPPKPPSDPASHGHGLQQQLETAIAQVAEDQGGFDDRRLFRFTVQKGFDPDDVAKIADADVRNDIEVISQEADEIVLAFVSEAALESFEALLTTLAEGGVPTNQQVFFALRGIDGWRPQDRMGWALRTEGFPEQETFNLDIELWPLEDNPPEREALWRAFEEWLAEKDIAKLDSVKQPGLTLFRVRCDRKQAESLLHHRDVRTVDLPPRYGIELHLRVTDIQDLGDIPGPPENAPAVTVLDSGMATGHPLLAPAIGEAARFLPGEDESDENGHGTLIGGLALYGDVETRLRDGRFVPSLRLFSGRILDRNNENETGFVENHIDEAVRYFRSQYGCRVFNLSFGDRNKPYRGGHVRGLAFVLDTLSRELGVLFVVSAGNVTGSQLLGSEWRARYPEYLREAPWTICDPAPALNALTVGSLARHDQTTNSQRFSGDPSEVPISRFNQPSPFTRHGPSIGGAIKPELVAYGGNWALNTRVEPNVIVPNSGLGELSTHWRYAAEGRLFSDDSGTSFSAPHVAYLASMLHYEVPEAGADLMRALLVAHAKIPGESLDLLGSDAATEVCGYGKVDPAALFRSLENHVSVIAEAQIANKRHHFYEVPLPEDFLSTGRRQRDLTVALAYTPYVRSTRIDYKASRIDFKVVTAIDLDYVSTMFNKATTKEAYQRIPELLGRGIGGQQRGKGTVQSATWRFRQFNSKSVLRQKRLFVVVTRNDFPWGENHSSAEEHYALVVALRDPENEEARLYTQIRARLQARARARV